MYYINFTRSVWLNENWNELEKSSNRTRVNTWQKRLISSGILYSKLGLGKFYKYKPISFIWGDEFILHLEALKLWNSEALKHPGSRRIKKALFVIRSSFIQDQAPTALWINNHPPIQDQAPTALEESVLRSSFFQDQAPTALGSTIHQFKIKPRRPLKKAPSFIIRSSKIKPQRPFGSTTSTNPHIQPFFKIKPKSPWRSVHHCSSRSSPKALGDPFITVLQRSSPKAPLKIRSNPHSKIKPTAIWRNFQQFIQDQASTALGSTKHPQINTLRRSN